MNNKLLKLTAIILLVFMLPVFSAFAEDITPLPDTENVHQPESSESTDSSDSPEDNTPLIPTAEDYRDRIIAYYDANSTLTSWWDVVALYGAGADLSDYTLPEWTSESLGESASATDYAGIIFGLIATEQNVHDIWDRDIADELSKMQDSQTGLFGTYPNQQIYAMLALDAAREPYNRATALNALIDTFSTEEGAFGYLPFDPEAEPIATPDTDITAMALLVLDQTIHADIIASSVTYLASQQLKNGGFASWGTENSNSLEAVISGLATLSLLEDERFIKNESSLSDVLAGYILESGALSWEAGSTEENLLATQQGLIAYGDIIAGESVFLRLTSNEVCSTINASVRIEGSAANVLNVPVSVKGYNQNLLDAILTALDANSIPYTLTGGNYLESIGSETAGKFGGWDGWLIALNGTAIPTSADAITLTENDEILVYYGMFESQTLIPEYTLSTTAYTQGESFTITVTGTYFDYTTSQNVTVPVSRATIEVGSSVFTTDQHGVAIVTPTSSGTQTVKIYKNNEGSYPSIVRTLPFTIDVAAAPVSVSPSYGGGSYTSPAKEDKTEDEPDKEPETTDPEADDKEENEPEDTAEVMLTYNDVDLVSDWAVEGVKKAVAAGLFKGDESGNINPQSDLSRAELATILLRLTSSEETGAETQFEDVSPDDWYCSAVCTVYNLGFMNGTGSSRFSPDSAVTREQAAVVLARILNLTGTESAGYSDSSEISDWAASAVNALTESGIMEGSDGKFNPHDILTREMCAVIMARALDFISEQKGFYQMKKALVFILCFLLLTSCGMQDAVPENTDISSADHLPATENVSDPEATEQNTPEISEPASTPPQDKNTPEPATQTVSITVLGLDGVLIYSAEAEYREGLTAFDLLMETAKEKNVPAVYTGSKSSPYITSIGGIAEKGHGPSSGWIYTVNGESIMKPSSKCVLNPSDRLEWKYITEFAIEQ